MTRPPPSYIVGAEERDGQGLKKGPWTPDEDQKLVAYIQQHGHGSWRSLPVNAGLQRCGKSCRLRWTNYLRPDIKRGRFSQEEDRMIVHLHAILGNRWSAIASHLPRRTDNEIKNYWNTHLKKRLLQMGIDPVTHKPTSLSEDLDSTSILSRPVMSSTLSHMSQWECARAEAEARLSHQSSTAQGVASPQQVEASSSFMSSWKEQVAETLRPSFGVVELEKLSAAVATTTNLQAFLHDWELSTSRPATFAAYDSPVEFPDFASSGTGSPAQYDVPAASAHALPSPAQITERLLASRGAFHNDVASLVLPAGKFSPPFIDDVSPTSTLQGPDHHYDSSSPCVSSSAGDPFDLLAHTLGLIHHESENSQPRSMFQADSPHFWQPPPSDPYILLPKPTFTQVAVPNNIPIPQFDFLC